MARREESMETIPLVTTEEDLFNSDEVFPESIPILPVKNTVLFPGVVLPITVGEKSVQRRPHHWCGGAEK